MFGAQRLRFVTMVGAVVIALAASSCGGSKSDDKSANAPDATLNIRTAAGDVKVATAVDFIAAQNGQGVSQGDTVRTNPTGFVEINYADKSLTRLDANALFTLKTLVASSGHRQIVGRLDGGRAWNRVTKLTATDNTYEVDTKVASAAVRGTGFDVDCRAADGSCTFTVVDGTVRVTPTGGQPVDVAAGQSMHVAADFTTTGAAASDPVLAGDPWFARNATLDAAAASSAATTTAKSAATTAATKSLGPDLGLDAFDICALLTDADVTFVIAHVDEHEQFGGSLSCSIFGQSATVGNGAQIILSKEPGATSCTPPVEGETCAEESGLGVPAVFTTSTENNESFVNALARGITISIEIHGAAPKDSGGIPGQPNNIKDFTVDQKHSIEHKLMQLALAHVAKL